MANDANKGQGRSLRDLLLGAAAAASSSVAVNSSVPAVPAGGGKVVEGNDMWARARLRITQLRDAIG